MLKESPLPQRKLRFLVLNYEAPILAKLFIISQAGPKGWPHQRQHVNSSIALKLWIYSFLEVCLNGIYLVIENI